VVDLFRFDVDGDSMSNARVNLTKFSPELFQTVNHLEELASQAVEKASLATGFAHLLRLRASQINGCSFCVRMHSRDAIAAGESADRVALVAAWRESQYFSEKERTALALVESITAISVGQVTESVYAEAAAHLSPEEIGAVEWLAIVINAWNRIAIASRYPVKA
jgi:AhpD family alkylhydroperoxidase